MDANRIVLIFRVGRVGDVILIQVVVIDCVDDEAGQFVGTGFRVGGCAFDPFFPRRRKLEFVNLF